MSNITGVTYNTEHVIQNYVIKLLTVKLKYFVIGDTYHLISRTG